MGTTEDRGRGRASGGDGFSPGPRRLFLLKSCPSRRGGGVFPPSCGAVRAPEQQPAFMRCRVEEARCRELLFLSLPCYPLAALTADTVHLAQACFSLKLFLVLRLSKLFMLISPSPPPFRDTLTLIKLEINANLSFLRH